MSDQEPRPLVSDSDQKMRDLIDHNLTRTHEGLDSQEVARLMADVLQAAPSAADAPVKVAAIVGGAASGKGTLASEVVKAYGDKGLSADAISTDNFLRGDRGFRRANIEDVGRPPIEKYDFEFMNHKIEQVRSGMSERQSVGMPTYDGSTGLAIDAGESNYTHRVSKVDALIVEGDFDTVVNPDVKFYLHVPDDVRLDVRIQRDTVERNATEDQIKANFDSRQETQHLPYTVGASETANYVIEAMPSEEGWRYDVYEPVEPEAA